MLIFFAPFLQRAWVIPFAAPPAPRIEKLFFLKDRFGIFSITLSIKPWPSVLSPIIFPFSNIIKLTAPSSFAVSDKTSHNLKAFSLNGTVIFNPE